MKTGLLFDGPTSQELRDGCVPNCDDVCAATSGKPRPLPVATTCNYSCICDGGMDCNPDRGKKTQRPIGRVRRLLSLLGFSTPPKSVELSRVLAFTFDPLIHRMVDKYGWDELEARAAFDDLKRYMWLAITTGKALVPSKTIDEIWHNFILFTMDYEEFCLTVLGRFLHHRPRRRDNKDDIGEVSPIGMTVELATKAFGTLSKNWEFPGVKVVARCSCSGQSCETRPCKS